ncbi:MAG: hypothetical protein DDT30_00607 [Dehalococcoidia bacterium]|nr:hypothetical protein [Bacillota bacterium]MBT9142035.1 hypothetical protein [Bacillota bacterium]
MDSGRWFFLILLIAFIAVSWGIRVFLSQRAAEKIVKQNRDEANK